MSYAPCAKSVASVKFNFSCELTYSVFLLKPDSPRGTPGMPTAKFPLAALSLFGWLREVTCFISEIPSFLSSLSIPVVTFGSTSMMPLSPDEDPLCCVTIGLFSILEGVIGLISVIVSLLVAWFLYLIISALTNESFGYQVLKEAQMIG